ncbi:MAG: helix-turn-helix domain-containing protein [Limisphaerales bacterium]
MPNTIAYANLSIAQTPEASESSPFSSPVLVDFATRRTRPHMPRPPVLTSESGPWTGFTVEQFAGGPADATDESPVHHHVVVQLDRPTSFEQRVEGHTHTFHVPPGGVSLFPALRPVTLRNRDTRDFLVIAIDPRLLIRAAHEIVQPEHFELQTQIAIEDPLIRGLALALRSEIQSGYAGGRCYGESLAHTLAIHLVRHYATAQQSVREDSGGLGRRPLRLVLDYIQEHLAEEISLETLAGVAGLSPFHFARLFKRSVGTAPHQYLIRRRVERAKELLLTTPIEIAAIASQVGFCDQSHLTSHFKRMYGIAPGAFLRSTTARISDTRGSLRSTLAA